MRLFNTKGAAITKLVRNTFYEIEAEREHGSDETRTQWTKIKLKLEGD